MHQDKFVEEPPESQVDERKIKKSSSGGKYFRLKIEDVELGAMMERDNEGGLKPRESCGVADVIASCSGCVVGNGLESRV